MSISSSYRPFVLQFCLLKTHCTFCLLSFLIALNLEVFSVSCMICLVLWRQPSCFSIFIILFQTRPSVRARCTSFLCTPRPQTWKLKRFCDKLPHFLILPFDSSSHHQKDTLDQTSITKQNSVLDANSTRTEFSAAYYIVVSSAGGSNTVHLPQLWRLRLPSPSASGNNQSLQESSCFTGAP